MSDQQLSLLGPDPNVMQRRASNPAHSVWVSASAGSGKTKVLTDRVLSLLLTGTRPERILCITFTKAAAAEMANRLNGILGTWATLPQPELSDKIEDLLDRQPDAETVILARQLFARVLDTPGGLKIQTVHSFCQSLLGRFPLEANVPPQFQVLDDRSASEMMARARDTVLRAAEGDTPLADALYQVTRRASEERFDELMRLLTSERGRIRRLINAKDGVDKAVAALFTKLDADPHQGETEVVAAACEEGVFDRTGLRDAAEKLLNEGKANDIKLGKKLESWLAKPLDGRIATYQDYRTAFLTAELEPRKNLMGKPLREAHPDLLTVLEREQERAVMTRDHIRTQVTAQASAGLLRLGEAMLRAYELEKKSRDLLDFDDLILKSRDLLTGDDASVAWVLFKLDGGLDHILIDEAQDTNPEQWEVVASLAEEFFAGEGQRAEDELGPRTVFAVGDVKQSIYSFQRADPEAFRRMRAHFEKRVTQAQQIWDMVPMDVSFRSTEPVLRAVDAVFAGAEAKDGLVAPEETVRHTAWRRGEAGRVEVWPLVEAEKSEDPEPWSLPLESEIERNPKQRLADALAAQIDAWIGSEMLPAKGRPMRAGDVMVLMRSRSSFVDMLVRALKARNVPVAGVDRMKLSQQIGVMDLVVLAQFLLMPEDDLALATVLKSPLLGLNDDDLFTLAYDRGKGRSLWGSLQAKSVENPRFAPARNWLAALLNKADFMRPFELFGEVLSSVCPATDRQETRELTGREAMVARLGVEAEDPLEEFQSMTLAYEQGNTPSMQGFLHWFAAGEAEIKRDLEAGERDEVRIMTVHGAKGLQAPVVIMPDTVGKPEIGRNAQLYWLTDAQDHSELPLWVIGSGMIEHEGAKARAAAVQAQDQEYRRLLYVALTRAEDRLIVCGAAGARSPRADCWYNLVWNGLETVAKPDDFDLSALTGEAWPGTKLVLESRQEQAVPAPEEKQEKAVTATLPEWARRLPGAEPVPPKPLAPSAPDEEDPPVRSPLGDDSRLRYQRGILVHRLLQSLPDLSSDQWDGAARRFLAQPAHGLAEAVQDELAREVVGVLTDTHLGGIFGPGSRAEVPIVGLIRDAKGKPQVVSGQVDRLVVRDDGVWVLDFKTLRPAPMEITRVPTAYLKQMAAYRAVLSQVYPGRPIHCALVWTEGPRMMVLDNAHLDPIHQAT